MPITDIDDRTALALLVNQIAEVRAVNDHCIARIRLFLAEGSLLQRRGVTLQY